MLPFVIAGAEELMLVYSAIPRRGDTKQGACVNCPASGSRQEKKLGQTKYSIANNVLLPPLIKYTCTRDALGYTIDGSF